MSLVQEKSLLIVIAIQAMLIIFLSRVSENMEIGSHVHKLLALTIAKVERCHLATLECMNPNHK